AVGTEESLSMVKQLIGEEFDEELEFTSKHTVARLMVMNKTLINKTLQELNLSDRFGLTITRIDRSGVEIPPQPQSRLRYGDRLVVVCFEESLPQVRKLIGDEQSSFVKTDLLPVFLGITIGLLMGRITIPLGFASFKPGMTGGILAAAIILGRIGKTGNVLWSLSATANNLLRQLGLMLFLASAGTKAGATIVSTISQNGISLLIIGICVTLLPMIVGLIIARFIFKLNYLTVLGVITGGMTSTPGLAAIEPVTETNAPLVSYAAVYPVALVLVIIYSQLISFANF
ncbi:MAG: TrkA C-terminal domain-containing protein, partial [Candidatus Cloacimonetes bacterium]|nr:TrkA C-terminal domain-containing protein [Candidatus Cloacimonadota bacterium]